MFAQKLFKLLFFIVSLTLGLSGSEGKSNTLIFLDSSDATLSINNNKIVIFFTDPWGSPYKEVSLIKESLVIQVKEYQLDNRQSSPRIRDLTPKSSGEYAHELDEFNHMILAFMWGWGPYTIGEKPETPANPELQEFVAFVSMAIEKTRLID